MASDVLIETTVATAEQKTIAFPAVAETIAAAAAKYKALTIVGINDRKGLAAVHEARMEVKNSRVAVEKTRKAAQRKLADEQVTKLMAEHEAAAKAEADRIAAEEQSRLDALKPVRDKLNRYSDLVAAVELPDVDADIKERIVEARMAFSLAVEGLAN